MNPAERISEPVGTREIAAMLEVFPGTVEKWRARHIFPEPDGMVSGTPWWDRGTVIKWAAATDRLPVSVWARETGRPT